MKYIKELLKRMIPDKLYLQILWYRIFKKKLNLKNPQTFNEKLQWLKLYDRKPEYITMVDKYEVKKYVASLIGEEFIVPTYGVWDKFDDIDFDTLPNQFVLKCTHDSGGVVIVRDKKSFDKTAAKKKLTEHLKRNFYWLFREWPYKYVKPRIIAEKYLEDKTQSDITDYKFMCFGGKVECLFTCTERNTIDGLKVSFFDKEWKELPFTRGYPKSTEILPEPVGLKKMIELSEILSKGITFIRTDFYELNENLYFGELIFYPGAGFEEFNPDEWDYNLGKLIKLPCDVGGGVCLLDKEEKFIIWIHEEKQENNNELMDYKFFCFNGRIKLLFIASERQNELVETKFDFYDEDFNHLEIINGHPNANTKIKKPDHFEKMKSLASQLSKGIPHLRVDFYEVNGKVFFGELTFFHWSGFIPFEPEEWDYRIGSYLELPKVR